MLCQKSQWIKRILIFITYSTVYFRCLKNCFENFYKNFFASFRHKGKTFTKNCMQTVKKELAYPFSDFW